MTEVKTELDNYKIWGYIVIPYEINNDFFIETEVKISEWKIKMDSINISWPNFWRWWKLNWSEIISYIKDCELFEKNLDTIIKIIWLPKQIWRFDDYYIEWFIRDKINDNYVEFWIKEITKEDIILLLSLLKNKAKEAIEKWKTLEFIWD